MPETVWSYPVPHDTNALEHLTNHRQPEAEGLDCHSTETGFDPRRERPRPRCPDEWTLAA